MRFWHTGAFQSLVAWLEARNHGQASERLAVGRDDARDWPLYMTVCGSAPGRYRCRDPWRHRLGGNLGSAGQDVAQGLRWLTFGSAVRLELGVVLLCSLPCQANRWGQKVNETTENERKEQKRTPLE